MAETFRSRLQKTVNMLLAPLGVQLTRYERVFSMDGLLARAQRRGFSPGTVIDIGASDGIWSLRAHRHFPKAKFLLFEPLAERQTALRELHRHKGFLIVAAAAGAAPGTVDFAIDPDLDGSGVAASRGHPTRAVPVETIRDAVAAHGLSGPFCLKLDTHGYEIPVLEGTGDLLDQTELLVIEAYNFQLTPDCLRFHELCAWLEARGFRCVDLADPMRRPRDSVLWQMDLAFAPANSPLFVSNRYE